MPVQQVEPPFLTCAVSPDGSTMIVGGESPGGVHLLRLEGMNEEYEPLFLKN